MLCSYQNYSQFIKRIIKVTFLLRQVLCQAAHTELTGQLLQFTFIAVNSFFLSLNCSEELQLSCIKSVK